MGGRELHWDHIPTPNGIDTNDIALIVANRIRTRANNLAGLSATLEDRHRKGPERLRFRTCTIEPDENATTTWHSLFGTDTRMPQRFETELDTLLVMDCETHERLVNLERLKGTPTTIKHLIENLRHQDVTFYTYRWPLPSSRDKSLVPFSPLEVVKPSQ